MRYYKMNEYDYWIPESTEERFIHLRDKLKCLKENNYTEAYTGYSIVFKDEFNKYKVDIKKGSIWKEVQIVKVNGSFVFYKNRVKKTGIYILNKWSFLRLFGGKYE